jgi:polyisoprenyl-phosphate glycosyltransferase
VEALPLFLSVILPIKNQAGDIQELLTTLSGTAKAVARDWEIVVVDNASVDDSVEVLRRLAGTEGLPNIQVFALSSEVDADTAVSAGLERSLGDFVCVLDPTSDTADALEEMTVEAAAGCDLIFARNLDGPRAPWTYRLSNALFNWVYRGAHGVTLTESAPPLRMLSRRVVNFILQHPLPSIAYRHLPATAAFPREYLEYRARPLLAQPKSLW